MTRYVALAVMVIALLGFLALGFVPDEGVSALVIGILVVTLSVAPITGTVCCVYIWRVYISDPGVAPVVLRPRPQGRSLIIWLFGVGATLVVGASYGVLYVVIRRFIGEPPLPGTAGAAIIGVFMLAALLVPHLYAGFIWSRRRESTKAWRIANQQQAAEDEAATNASQTTRRREAEDQ